jgi:hypothetical protein
MNFIIIIIRYYSNGEKVLFMVNKVLYVYLLLFLYLFIISHIMYYLLISFKYKII